MHIRKKLSISAKMYGSMLAVILLGAAVGSIIYGAMEQSFAQRLENLGSGFVLVRSEQRFSLILLRTLSSSTLFLFVIFLSGFCPVGHLMSAAALGVRGIGMGVMLSQLYLHSGAKAIAVCTAGSLPNAIISSAALALAAREAVCLSNTYALFTLSDRQEQGLKEQVKLYCTKFAVLEAVMALCAGLDCLSALLINKL